MSTDVLPPPPDMTASVPQTVAESMLSEQVPEVGGVSSDSLIQEAPSEVAEPAIGHRLFSVREILDTIRFHAQVRRELREAQEPARIVGLKGRHSLVHSAHTRRMARGYSRRKY